MKRNIVRGSLIFVLIGVFFLSFDQILSVMTPHDDALINHSHLHMTVEEFVEKFGEKSFYNFYDPSYYYENTDKIEVKEYSLDEVYLWNNNQHSNIVEQYQYEKTIHIDDQGESLFSLLINRQKDLTVEGTYNYDRLTSTSYVLETYHGEQFYVMEDLSDSGCSVNILQKQDNQLILLDVTFNDSRMCQEIKEKGFELLIDAPALN